MPMSEIFLFKVVDAFNLAGLPELVLVPGLPQNPELPTIRVGAQIRLVAPDGTYFETQISGFKKISYGRKQARDKICMPISLPPSISKEQIPVGTEVFLLTAKSVII
jgi:hypothetical protein